jgi:hypothetical protein
LLRYLVRIDEKYILVIKATISELVTTRRSIVLILPFNEDSLAKLISGYSGANPSDV